MKSNCTICNRELEVKSDALSADCGGDCWGCIGEIEADGGYERSLIRVRKEFSEGLRQDWMPSPEASGVIDSESRIRITVRLCRPLGEPWENETFDLKVVYKKSPANEEIVECAILCTNALGECIHTFENNILQNSSDNWFYVIRKKNEWGYPISGNKNA